MAEDFTSCMNKAYTQSTWGAVQYACVACYAAVGKGDAGPNSCEKQSNAWCVKRQNYCDDTASQCDVVMPECQVSREAACDADVGTTLIDGKCVCPLTGQPPERGQKCLKLPDKIPTPTPKTNPTPDPSPTPTPDPTPTGDTSGSGADPTSAVNRCEASYANAEQACSSAGAAAGGGSTSGQSIAQLCAEWNATGTVAGDVNTNAGSACTAAYRSCVSTCESLADQVGPTSPGAGNELLYIADDCYALGDRAMALGSQGLSSYNSAEMGRMCNQNAKAQSTGEGFGGGGRGSARAVSTAAESLEQKALDFARGDAGFLDATDAEKTHFNADSLEDGPRVRTPSAQIPIGSGGRGTVVPNNSGTSLPSGESKAGLPAAAPPATAKKLSGGRVNADILQGLEAGGSGFERATRERRDRDLSQAFKGDPLSKAKEPTLDLKKHFDRGFKEALRRRMAGRFYSNALGIHGSGVDIFSRITERIREKCAMGVLVDCR